MPPPRPQKQGDPGPPGMLYVEVTDFTSGISQEGPSPLLALASTPSHTPGMMARTNYLTGTDKRETYGCYGHPNGGLAPLPKAALVQSMTPPNAADGSTPALWPADPVRAPQALLMDTAIQTPLYSASTGTGKGIIEHPDRVFALFNWHHDGLGIVASQPGKPQSKHLINSWDFYTADQQTPQVWQQSIPKATDGQWSALVGVALGQDASNAFPKLPIRNIHMSGGLAIGTTFTAGTAAEGVPHLYAAFGDYQSGITYVGSDFAYTAPNLAGGVHYIPLTAPTPSGTVKITPLSPISVANTRIMGPMHCMWHQQRLIVFASGSDASMSTGLASGIMRNGSNNLIYWTNPGANTMPYETDSTAQLLLTAEDRQFGSWVSMNANEMFVALQDGGGYAVRGDIEYPQIVHLPAVASTSGAGSIGCMTPLGYVYGTRDGVFAWAGGDTTENVSPNLEGWFWDVENGTNAYRGYNTPKGKFAYRYPWVFAPNNYVMDVRTKGWFRLEAPVDSTVGGLRKQWWGYEAGFKGVYAFNAYCPITVAPTSHEMIYRYDLEMGQSVYTALLHPLPIAKTRSIEIREVIVKAQCDPGSASQFSIGFLDKAGTVVHEVTLALDNASRNVQVVRVPLSHECTDLQPIITALSASYSAAPRLHSIAFGYREGTLYSNSNPVITVPNPSGYGPFILGESLLGGTDVLGEHGPFLIETSVLDGTDVII